MIDCRNFKLTDIRPLTGQVLVELLPPPNQSGPIVLPESFRDNFHKGTAEGPAQPWEGLVRKLGAPEPKRPFEVVLGDRVIVSHYASEQRAITEGRRRFKLVTAANILAKFI